MSASISTTRRASCASATARLTASVVAPTPGRAARNHERPRHRSRRSWRLSGAKHEPAKFGSLVDHEISGQGSGFRVQESDVSKSAMTVEPGECRPGRFGRALCKRAAGGMRPSQSGSDPSRAASSSLVRIRARRAGMRRKLAQQHSTGWHRPPRSSAPAAPRAAGLRRAATRSSCSRGCVAWTAAGCVDQHQVVLAEPLDRRGHFAAAWRRPPSADP